MQPGAWLSVEESGALCHTYGHGLSGAWGLVPGRWVGLAQAQSVPVTPSVPHSIQANAREVYSHKIKNEHSTTTSMKTSPLPHE